MDYNLADSLLESSVFMGQERLNGWKEIAAYFGKGVRTVQRWEKNYGLSIHRIGDPGAEIVYAFRSELAAWERSSSANTARSVEGPSGQPVRSRLRTLIAAAAVVVGGVAIGGCTG